MIYIYILWHFLQLFFIFCNKYINGYMCLVIFNVLLIEKITNQKVYWYWYRNINPQNIDYRIEFKKYVIAHH